MSFQDDASLQLEMQSSDIRTGIYFAGLDTKYELWLCTCGKHVLFMIYKDDMEIS